MEAQLFGPRRNATGVRICKTSCNSFACSDCGPLVGYQTRQRLLDRYASAGIDQVGLCTLTINDDVVAGTPEEQYAYIRDHRLIGDFVRHLRTALGVDVGYFRVCEFGKKTGRLHYHLLIDDLGRLHRDKLHALQDWSQRHLGTMDYKYRSVLRGVRYVCKYLTKGSDGSLPDFVLDMNGFKFFSSSRGFWMTRRIPRERTKPAEPTKRNQRTLRVRLLACGESVIGLAQSIDEHGERKHGFAFTLRVPLGKLAQILAEEAPEQILGVNSSWPTGSPRWIDVGLEMGRKLAALAYQGADRRAAASAARGGSP